MALIPAQAPSGVDDGLQKFPSFPRHYAGSFCGTFSPAPASGFDLPSFFTLHHVGFIAARSVTRVQLVGSLPGSVAGGDVRLFGE